MKTIKIILAIISVLVIAFFVTGLFLKETAYTASVTINKPIDEVFIEFNKIENIQNWIKDVKSVEVIEKKMGTIGSSYTVVVDNNGEEIILTEKVLAYIPNEKVTLFYDAENMLKTDDYLFSTENDKTILLLKASCKSNSYILSCLFPFFKSVFKKQDQTYLNNFKDFIEKS